MTGCVSHYTYPANRVPDSIEKICREEYKMDATARVVGKTVGALLYVDELIDSRGQLPKDVQEKMGKIVQVVTRVALSTELPLDFLAVVLRDRKSNNELTITRSIDDTRRANAEVIGADESISRTLFDQSKYTSDQATENVTGTVEGIDAPSQQVTVRRRDTGAEESIHMDPELINTLKIGSQVTLDASPFILKEVHLENFLAEQIVQRIRFGFSRENNDTKKKKKEKSAEDENAFNPAFVLVDGVFEQTNGSKDYRFSIISMKSEDPKETMLNVFKTINEVLAGYQFTGFDNIEIQDFLNRQKLVLDRETLLNYQKHKIRDADIISRFRQESQSVQEAFKLFGFNNTAPEKTVAQDTSAAAVPNP